MRRDFHAKMIVGLACIYALFCAYNTNGSVISPERAANMIKAAPVTNKLERNWKALKKRNLRLLPVPKELEFTGDVIPWDKLAIVIKNNDKTGQIAANEISSRIEKLTGRKPSILKEPEAGMYNIIIDNTFPNNKFTSDGSSINLPGKDQAYGLYPSKDSIVLSGRGKQGMLWAAVTARWLIGEKDNKIVFYPAKVVDWPDFEMREVARVRGPYMERYRSTPEKHLEDYKKYIDFSFRIKCNVIRDHTFQPWQGEFSPFKTGEEVSHAILKAIRLVNDYAKDRGITPWMTCLNDLGKKPHQKSPELEVMQLMPHYKTYISWARHDLHRIKARKLAKFCADAGYSQCQLHSPDGGGIQDPEMWSERDSLSRKMYPSDDDRSRADWDVLKIYYEELKKSGIDIVFIQYPYSAKYLNSDDTRLALNLPDNQSGRELAGKLSKRMKNDMRMLDKLTPKDVKFLLREEYTPDNFKNLKLFFDLCNRKIIAWIYVSEYLRDRMDLLPPESASFRSILHPNVCGVHVMNENRLFTEPALACAAEYLWNTAFPGWQYMDRINYFTEGTRPSQEKIDIMAERAAVGLWGAEAGKELKEIFDRGLSIDIAVDPQGREKRLNIKNMSEVCKENHNALLRAEKAIDLTLLEMSRNGGSGKVFMDDFSKPFFYQYYLMIKGAIPYSITNLAVYQSHATLKSGDFENADKILKEAIKHLSNAETEFNRVSVALSKEPVLYSWKEADRYHRTLPKMKSLNPDFKALKERLEQEREGLGKTYEQIYTPAWFGNFLSQRHLVAVKTSTPIKIDGSVSESEWGNAAAIEHFTGANIQKMPPEPIVMRMLYDDKNLYVSGVISHAQISAVNVKKHGISEYVPAESAEIFLVPSELGDRSFKQVIIDAGGGLFTKSVSVGKTVTGIDLGIMSAVAKNQDGWIFEMSIPFEKLGAFPGKDWKAMLAYNRAKETDNSKLESFSSSFTDGKGFLSPSLYSSLLFASSPPEFHADIKIKCTDIAMKEQIHSDGTGSLITFRPAIETRRPLKNVSVDARFLIKNKKKVGALTIDNISFLPLVWNPVAPMQFQMQNVHKGVILELNVHYQTLDGKKGEVSKSFIIGDIQAVVSDEDIFQSNGSGGKALTFPVYIDTSAEGIKFISGQSGEISIKIFPGEKFINQKESQCIFDLGPDRRKNPLIVNKSSITAVAKNNILNFSICNGRFEQRGISALLKLPKEEWTVLDFKWNLDNNGKTEMSIFANGKKITGDKVTAWRRKDGTLSMSAAGMDMTVMQLGCLNSGLWPSHCMFKDLVVSSNGAIMSFSFDGTLNGKYISGVVGGKNVAQPGIIYP